MTFRRIGASSSLILATLLCAAASSSAQEREFQVDPSQSEVKFNVGDVLHTVHGTFKVKSGNLQINPSGRMSGQIVVDARSGDSGSGMRDRKMHKEVLESERYSEIVFRPDRIEGAVPGPGTSSVQVHGVFSIHGVDREITVPAQVNVDADHWNATVHFTVPYQKWGMKNPSTLFLRVNDSVEIDLLAAGSVSTHGAISSQ